MEKRKVVPRRFTPEQLVEIASETKRSQRPMPGEAERQGSFKSITDKELKKIVDDKRYTKGISVGENLTFTYLENGKPEFYFIKYIDGKKRSLKIGSYKDVKLSDARKKAFEYKCLIDSGENVFAAIRSQKNLAKNRLQNFFKQVTPSGDSFGERDLGEPSADWDLNTLTEFYYQKFIKSKIRTDFTSKSRFERYITPHFRGVAIASITTTTITDFLNTITYPTVRAKLYFDLNNIFEFACSDLNLLHKNPAQSKILRIEVAKSTKTRDRYLTEDEIIDLFEIIDGIPKVQKEGQPFFAVQNYYAIRLLLSSGGRKSEILQSKWSSIDFNDGCLFLDGSQTKTGAPIRLFLHEYALDTLKELKVLAGKSDYIFPQRRKGKTNKPHVGVDTLNRALYKTIMPIFMKRRNGTEHFTIHDLRRTARTALGKLGVDEMTAERCINHKISQGSRSQRTYDLHNYEPEMRDAFMKLGDYISKLDCGYKKNS